MSSIEQYKILVEKEYTKIPSKKPSIGLVMMLKNEKKQLHVSLNSIVGYVDCLIIYDTGSTDNTVEIIKNHCEKHKINLYLIQGVFENFSVSRNVLLKYADKIDVKYLLMLDCNDQLRGGEHLLKFAKDQQYSKHTGYLVCQEWFTGQSYDKYFNVRFLKNKSGWRYRGSVHEWIKNENYDEKDTGAPAIYRMKPDIILFQDRTNDDDKSTKRFARDKQLLLEDHKKNRTEPRTLFYLAQTCSCLNQNEDALYYYKLRSELGGFEEEKFHSYLRAGEISEKLNHNWYDAMSFYMKAIEHSQRAEPYIKLGEHYHKLKKYDLAYMFIATACNLNYPDHCILFVDKHAYTYVRWHLLGILGFYVGKYQDGKNACEIAIKNGSNVERDEKNLKFYTDKMKPQSSVQTKQQFINLTLEELKQENPNLNIKKLLKIANNRWKNRLKN